MSIFHVSDEIDSARFSRKINKRVVLILLLSAFLLIFGSIPLETFSKKPVSLQPTPPITSHMSRITHTPVPSPTLTPTPNTTHAPILDYPLFNGNTHIPEIALTFDDGPNPYYTPQVLAILQKFGIKATFFDVGYLVADYPAIVRQEYNQGNVVANHSWSHPLLTKFSGGGIQSQLTSTNNIIQTTIGVRPTFFRPPYGAINNQVLFQAHNLHYTTVMWDGSGEDWTLPGVYSIVNKALSFARNGAILLFHDGGGNRAQTVAALPIIITALKSRGFKLVTIQQLVDDLVTSHS